MKAAKKLAADVRRLRTLVESLRAQERVSSGLPGPFGVR